MAAVNLPYVRTRVPAKQRMEAWDFTASRAEMINAAFTEQRSKEEVLGELLGDFFAEYAGRIDAPSIDANPAQSETLAAK
jgi:hypothetical protein